MAFSGNDVWEKMYEEFTSKCDDSGSEREEMENFLYSKIHFIQQDSDLKSNDQAITSSKSHKITGPMPCVISANDMCQNYAIQEVSVDISGKDKERVSANETKPDQLDAIKQFFTKFSDATVCNESLKSIENGIVKEKKNKKPDRKGLGKELNKLNNKLALVSMLKKETNQFAPTSTKNSKGDKSKVGRAVVEVSAELSPVITESSSKLNTEIIVIDDKTEKILPQMETGNILQNVYEQTAGSGLKAEKTSRKNKVRKRETGSDEEYKVDKKIRKIVNKEMADKRDASWKDDRVIEISSDFSPVVAAPKIKRHVAVSDSISKGKLYSNDVILVSSTSDEKDSPNKTKKEKQCLTNPIIISDSSSDDDCAETQDHFARDLHVDLQEKEYSKDSEDESMDELLCDGDVSSRNSQDAEMDFNVIAGQESLVKKPDNPEECWYIIDHDRYNHIYKRMRYFGTDSLRCKNCLERGHLTQNCPEPRRVTCMFCGARGHWSRTCPESFCFNCYDTNHTTYMCRDKIRQASVECHRCLMGGHMQNVCPDIWRRYHMTITTGKIKEVKENKNRKKCCYNCGSRNHFGFECRKPRMDKYAVATYPFIAQYQGPSNQRVIFADSDEESRHVKKKRKLNPSTKWKNKAKKAKFDGHKGCSGDIEFAREVSKVELKVKLKKKKSKFAGVENDMNGKSKKKMKTKFKKKELKDQNKEIYKDHNDRRCLNINESAKNFKRKREKITAVPVHHENASHRNISRGFKLRNEYTMKKIKR